MTYIYILCVDIIKPGCSLGLCLRSAPYFWRSTPDVNLHCTCRRNIVVAEHHPPFFVFYTYRFSLSSALSPRRQTPCQLRRAQARQGLQSATAPAPRVRSTVINGENTSALYSSIRSIASIAGSYTVERVPNSFVGQVLSFLDESCPFVASATATANSDAVSSTISIEVTNTLQTYNRFARPPSSISSQTFFPSRNPREQSHFPNPGTRHLLIESSSSSFPITHSYPSSTTPAELQSSHNEPRGSNSFKPQGFKRKKQRGRPGQSQSLASRIDSYRPNYNPYQDHRRSCRYRSPSPPPPPPPPIDSSTLIPSFNGEEEEDRPCTPSWKRS